MNYKELEIILGTKHNDLETLRLLYEDRYTSAAAMNCYKLARKKFMAEVTKEKR